MMDPVVRFRRPLVFGLAAVVLFAASLTVEGASLDERISACAGCHGEDGNSQTENIPSLAGQPQFFLLMQLVLMREGVRRDLGWLFNTTNLASVRDIEPYPLVGGSVLNFGLPDLAGHTVSSIDVVAVERLLRRAIWDFEPRLVRSSVKVRLGLDREQMNHNAMSFDIEAMMWAQPLPLRLFLRTEIDLETGNVQVAELPGGDRG